MPERPQAIAIPPASERPTRLPSDANFSRLIDLTNELVAHHGGDRSSVAKDLVSMAGALLAGADEGPRCALARAMTEAARQLDGDAERAPHRLQ